MQEFRVSSATGWDRFKSATRRATLCGAVALFTGATIGAVAHAQTVDLQSAPGASNSGATQDSRHAAGKGSTIHPIRGFLPDLEFELMAAGNKKVTEEDFEDRIVMMFFGYASCPDICPTTMAQLSMVMESLGDQAEHVRVLFVSVDPHRDTPEILQAYVDAFGNRHAIGLTGTERQISRLARRYRVAYQIEKPTGDDPDSYEVAHSRGIYIFDADGKARMLASDGESVDALVGAVRELLPQAS